MAGAVGAKLTTEYDNLASISVMRKIGMAVEFNPEPTPEWFQAVGVLFNPALQAD